MRKFERMARKEAKKYGGEMSWTGGTHMLFEFPDGTKLTVSSSPRTPEHAIIAFRKEIRRYVNAEKPST